jgi:hypothetical protein
MLSQEVHLLCDLQVFTSFSRKTNNEIKSQNHHKELPHVEMHWLAYVQSSIFCRHAFYIVFFLQEVQLTPTLNTQLQACYRKTPNPRTEKPTHTSPRAAWSASRAAPLALAKLQLQASSLAMAKAAEVG